MGLLNWWKREGPTPSTTAQTTFGPRADAAATFDGLNDPRLALFLRGGGALTSAGVTVDVYEALKNTTVFRCVNLISSAIGMLPLHLLKGGDDFDADKATDHPLYDLLYAEPNDWQTAYDFRSHMQLMALVHGDAYAMVVRSNGRVVRLVPLDAAFVTVEQNSNWTLTYKHRQQDGTVTELLPENVFHLRGLSLNSIQGLSLVRQAAEAIGLARQLELTTARLFANGMMVGGAITHPTSLGPQALANLQASIEARHGSPENAGRWMILEEGMKAEKFAATAQESQQIEMRRLQIEEIGRIFGVPRPLLGVDDTSWGTGIEQLGIGFVRYGLNQWFTAWEQAISRTLLVGDEKKTLRAKFNEGGLLRGSMKDQADFFAKALGAGGHRPWMKPNEVRDLMNLSPDKDPSADTLAPVPPPAPGQYNEGIAKG